MLRELLITRWRLIVILYPKEIKTQHKVAWRVFETLRDSYHFDKQQTVSHNPFPLRKDMINVCEKYYKYQYK